MQIANRILDNAVMTRNSNCVKYISSLLMFIFCVRVFENERLIIRIKPLAAQAVITLIDVQSRPGKPFNENQMKN